MHILNNGRMSLGTGSVGGAKFLLDLSIDHVKERKQFGRPLADFELVQDKVGWMVSYLFGLESMAYLTCGLVDAGVPDYSLESAIVKVSGTEFLWYAANRALQLKGGAGYMRDEPYEKAAARHPDLPDLRGRQRRDAGVHRAVGHQAGGRAAERAWASLNLGDPVGSIGVLAEYVTGRIQREVRPERVTLAHDELSALADPLTDQVKRLASASESVLREHKGEIVERQFHQKRLADAVADVYAQIAVLSRVTAIFDEHGVEPSGQERYIAQTFCTRAAQRVNAQLDQIESNDDERMTAIAKLAYRAASTATRSSRTEAHRRRPAARGRPAVLLDRRESVSRASPRAECP